MKKKLLLLSSVFCSLALFSQTVRYVTTSGAGMKNGSDWTNAYASDSLQAALNEADEVRLAGGETYTLTTPIHLSNGKKLTGSYDIATGAQNLSAPTILTGTDTRIMQVSNGTAEKRNKVEGIHFKDITRTNDESGLAVFIEMANTYLTIEKCKFINLIAIPTSDIKAKGIINTTASNSNIDILSTTFSNCSAQWGVIVIEQNAGSVVNIDKCVFDNCKGRGATTGGVNAKYNGVLHLRGAAKVTNSIFKNGNASTESILSPQEGTLKVQNCTFANNITALYLSTTGATIRFENNVLFNTSTSSNNPNGAVTVKYCAFKGANGTNNNINIIGKTVTDLFISDADLSLVTGSPLIDTGTASEAPISDLIGSTRPQGNSVDIGAYEFIPSTTPMVQSSGVSNITAFGATLSGKYFNIADTTEVGFEWGLKNVEGFTNKVAVTSLTSPFSHVLTGLKTDITYKYRAYVKSDTVTIYGSEISFTPVLNYCQGPVGTRGTTERYISSITTSGAEQNINLSGLPSNTPKFYFDKTTEGVLKVIPGQNVTISFTGGGVWIHTYLYADWNKDGVFGTTGAIDENGKFKPSITHDLIGYNYYKASGKPAYTSSGTNAGDGSIGSNTSITFTIPNEAPIGRTRFRVAKDWNNLDPCAGTGLSIGGNIVDLSIEVINTETTVSIESSNNAMGTVAITSPDTTALSITTSVPVTVTATPAANHKFVNWVDKTTNATVSTSPVYNVPRGSVSSLVANFVEKDKYTISVTVMPEGTGTVAGTIGIFYEGNMNTISLTATPNSEYTFTGWDQVQGDGSTTRLGDKPIFAENDGLEDITIDRSVELIAQFTRSVGITTATASGIKLSVNNQMLHIENAVGAQVEVRNVLGRLMSSSVVTNKVYETSFSVPAGIYIISIVESNGKKHALKVIR